MQVGIQFELEDNVFTDVSFRQLAHDDSNYRLMEEGEEGFALLQQYEQAIAYLVGNPLEAIYDLHAPEFSELRDARPHAKIDCLDCHGEGFTKDKINGMGYLLNAVTGRHDPNNYLDINTSVPDEKCLSCHNVEFMHEKTWRLFIRLLRRLSYKN